MSSLEALFNAKGADTTNPTAEKRVEQLLALNRAAIAITSELELSSLLQKIVDVARDLVGCRYAALGVLGEDGYISRFPTSGVSEEEREKIGAPPRGHGLLGVMLRAGRTLRIPDISKDKRRSGFPPNHPRMTSLLGVPIFVQGKLAGDLYLTDKYDGTEFTEEDEWIVQLLATHAATALTNANLHAVNKEAYSNLRALQDAVQRIASHLDLESLADELLKYAVQLTHSDWAWLGLVDERQRVLVPVAWQGGEMDAELMRDRRIFLADGFLGAGPSGRAVRTLAPQVVSEIALDPTFQPWQDLIQRFGVNSAVAMPLAYQGRALGVLNLYAQKPGAYDAADLALISVLSDHAAVALQNSMNYRQVSRERARSQALLKVNEAINRSVHLDEVIPLIVESAAQLIGAAGAAVYLPEEQRSADGQSDAEDNPAVAVPAGEGVVVARYSVGLDAAPTTIMRLALDKSIAGRALSTGQVQVVEDSAKESGVELPRLVKGPLRSLVVVPLKVGERGLGVLSAYSERPGAFDEEAVQLLEAFGAQASTAIYNAHLYEVAERGRQAAELEQERLRELEQMKDEFLSTAAHELRTPLTTIRMSAGLAHEQMKMEAAQAEATTDGDGVDPRLVELVGLVVEGSERMHSLVNDLLDLTRLEQGRTTLAHEDLDMREVVESAVESVMPLFDSKHQDLTMHLPEGYCWVRGDKQRLEQVIVNLLSNAHKYSPEGSKVEVRMIRTRDACMVTVRDRGTGVPEDERERIFERFYRSSLHRNDRTASTGLGLPIARKVAEMHHGRLWVEPAPGQGSIFTLVLPVAR